MTVTGDGSADAGNLEQGTNSAVDTAGAVAAQAAADSSAFAGLDAEMRAFAENKGWTRDQNPMGAVLKSYRELEGRIGNSVTLPAEDDADGWRKLYARIGMPEKPDGYDFKLPEKHDPETVGWAKDLFHEAGLSKAQAATVHAKFMERAGAIEAASTAQAEEAAKAKAEEAAAAAKEIGEARMTGAKEAFARFVDKDDELGSKLEAALGDGTLIRFFDNLAQAMGEDGKGSLGVRGEAGGDKEYSFKDIVSDAFQSNK